MAGHQIPRGPGKFTPADLGFVTLPQLVYIDLTNAAHREDRSEINQRSTRL